MTPRIVWLGLGPGTSPTDPPARWRLVLLGKEEPHSFGPTSPVAPSPRFAWEQERFDRMGEGRWVEWAPDSVPNTLTENVLLAWLAALPWEIART